MNRKTLITLIAGSVGALLLICILLVGVLDGIWPWDGITAYGRLISSQHQNSAGPRQPTETTGSTEEGGAQGEEIRPTVGETGQNGTPPTLPKENDVQVGIEIDGVTQPTGGNSTESTDSTTPTVGEKDYDAGFSFSDLPVPPASNG